MSWRGPFPITEPSHSGSLRQFPTEKDPRHPLFGSNLFLGGRPAPYRFRIRIDPEAYPWVGELNGHSFIAKDITAPPDGPIVYGVNNDPLVQSNLTIKLRDPFVGYGRGTHFDIRLQFLYDDNLREIISEEPEASFWTHYYILDHVYFCSTGGGSFRTGVRLRTVPWDSPDFVE